MKNNPDATRVRDYCKAMDEWLYTPARINDKGFFLFIKNKWQPAKVTPKPELRRLQSQLENPDKKSLSLQ